MSQHAREPSSFEKASRKRSSWSTYVRPVGYFVEYYSGPLIVSLAAGTAFCAYLGVFQHQPDISINTVTASIYEAAQSLALDMDPHDKEYNDWVGAARVFAVLLVVFLAYEAITKIFMRSLEDVWLSFRGNQIDIFVGGMGRIGFHVATTFASERVVVALENDAADHWVKNAEDAGVYVRNGDVNNLENLRTYINQSPTRIYLVTGNDLDNLNALAHVQRIREANRNRWWGTLRDATCYVHIASPALQSSLEQSLVLVARKLRDSGLNVRVFNLYHETARQLIINKLTPLRPTHPDEVALYIIFGFGHMGQAMMKELAEFAHFENFKRPRILILTTDPEGDCQEALSQWGRLSPAFVRQSLDDVKFDPECDSWESQKMRPGKFEQSVDPTAVEYAANVCFCKVKSSETLSHFEVNELVRLATAPNTCAAVLFCHEEDEHNFRLATHLNDLLQDFHGINKQLDFSGDEGAKKRELCVRHEEFSIPLFAFLSRSRSLRAILSEVGQPFTINPFGEVHEALKRVHDTLIESLAIYIACNYDHSRYADARKGWLDRPFWDRQSNLSAAEHALILVQILGFRIADDAAADAAPLDEKTLEAEVRQTYRHTMKLVEHNRWMAERLLIGWRFGNRMNQPPQRTTLCPKKAIPANELQKDLDQIIAVFRFFESRGILFERIPPAPAREKAVTDSNEPNLPGQLVGNIVRRSEHADETGAETAEGGCIPVRIVLGTGQTADEDLAHLLRKMSGGGAVDFRVGFDTVPYEHKLPLGE
jgi:hypothetical protein